MLAMRRQSGVVEDEVKSLAGDLLESAIRKMVWCVLGVGLVLWMGVGIYNDDVINAGYFSLAMLLIGLTFLAIWLVSRRPPLALVLWQMGLVMLVTLSTIFYPKSHLALFYVVLPLIAVVTSSWQMGVLIEIIITALVFLLVNLGYLPAPAAEFSLTIILGGGLLGIIAWAVFDSFYIFTHWAIYYSQQSKASLQRARDQQVELFQIQQDLITANEEISRLLKQFKALQQVAENARQAKSEFVSIVSHELRAPLNMIIGFSELITRSPRAYGPRIPHALIADIGIIQRNAVHLSRLIDDVLDMSQIEAGRMALSKEKTNAGDLVKSAVEIIYPLYESKNLYLTATVPDQLPELYCDAMRIRQILVNLLSNAGRFTQQGGTTVKVWQEDSWMVLSVSDTGPGIAREDQVHLFEPFHQVDTSIRREHGGSGLGLSISKRFIEMHGGEIRLESEPGAGTTFTIRLPLEPLPLVEVEPVEAYKRWVNPQSQIEKRDRPFQARLPSVLPQIVLVENEGALQQIFSRYSDDISLAAFNQFEAAAKHMENSPAQAVVINSPEVTSPDGFGKMQQEIAALPDTTPVIACWLPGRAEAASQMGVVDYLIKPVTSEQLLAAVRRLGLDVKTLLLVDDDPDLLLLFSRELSAAGYRVWRAENAAEALEVMRTRHPDLALLDMILPEKSGKDLLEEKSRDESIRSIPVITVSAQDVTYAALTYPTMLVSKRNGFSVRELIDFVQLTCQALSLKV